MRGSGAAVSHAPVRDRAAIVGLRFGTRRRDAAERSLDELAGLAAAAGADVALRSLRERPRPAPARFFGRGKVRQLGAAVSTEVEGPVHVVERRRRDGRGRESPCA